MWCNCLFVVVCVCAQVMTVTASGILEGEEGSIAMASFDVSLSIQSPRFVH